MRDIMLISLVICYAPMVVRFPHIGIYLWTWVALMNPHRLVYAFARGQSFNLWIAIITMTFWLFSREKKIPDKSGFIFLIGAFAVCMTASTIFAISPSVSWPMWEQNIKTLVLIYLILCIINTRLRLHVFLWVYVLSIGYWSINTGLVTIASGGNAVIVGPPSSMIFDNNHLALAMTICIPMANYLRIQSSVAVVRWGLAGLIFLSAAGVIGTYSRGGLISLAVVALFAWWYGKHKVFFATLGLVALLAVPAFLPEEYLDRAGTIAAATEDNSFLSRLEAWNVAWETAKSKPLGAGFVGPQQPQNWSKHSDMRPYASHSIYFMVLGEHGFLGIVIYIAIVLSAWVSISRFVKREQKSQTPEEWALQLGISLKCSIAAFMVGGAALSLSYYDGFLILLSICIIVPKLAASKEEAKILRYTHPGQRSFGGRSVVNPAG